MFIKILNYYKSKINVKKILNYNGSKINLPSIKIPTFFEFLS